MSDFFGLVLMADATSKVSNCAVGEMAQGKIFSFKSRIVGANSQAVLQRNISHDANRINNPAEANANGKEGQSVSAAAFNQYYFEHNLGWDFDTVWQWNDAENHPELRPQPRPDWAMTAAAEPLQVAEGQTSLLLQQLQANIWLRQG